jgi:hypothetical protein
MFGQYLKASPKTSGYLGTPVRKAEPRRGLKRSPQELFRDFFDKDDAVRTRAMNELTGSSLDGFWPVSDATLRAVDLNEDGRHEYIILLHSRLESDVFVIDGDPGKWQIIGHFNFSHHWNAEDAERLVEVHAPFILIRDFGGGTGVTSSAVRLYRCWKGALYQVFEMTEYAHFWEARAPGVASDTTEVRILFRGESFSEEPVLEVRRTDTTEFIDLRRPRQKVSCKGYEWAAASFSLQSTARATNALCQSGSH